RLLDNPYSDLQECRCRLNQFIVMDGTVAIFSKLLKDVTDASLGTDDRIPWDAQPLGQAIRGFEANAVDVEGEAIRILPYSWNGLVAIGFVNAHRTRRPDPMRMQKDHNLSNNFLRFPCRNHSLFAFRTNALE